jgi:hypothetical protein
LFSPFTFPVSLFSFHVILFTIYFSSFHFYLPTASAGLVAAGFRNILNDKTITPIERQRRNTSVIARI